MGAQEWRSIDAEEIAANCVFHNKNKRMRIVSNLVIIPELRKLWIIQFKDSVLSAHRVNMPQR